MENYDLLYVVGYHLPWKDQLLMDTAVYTGSLSYTTEIKTEEMPADISIPNIID